MAWIKSLPIAPKGDESKLFRHKTKLWIGRFVDFLPQISCIRLELYDGKVVTCANHDVEQISSRDFSSIIGTDMLPEKVALLFCIDGLVFTTLRDYGIEMCLVCEKWFYANDLTVDKTCDSCIIFNRMEDAYKDVGISRTYRRD